MKQTFKDRRVVNIPKEDFDNIKKYCDENSLDMPKWIVKNSLEKLAERIPEHMLTAKEAMEISKKSQQVIIPKNWLEIVMKRIDNDIKRYVSNFNSTNEIKWWPIIQIVNVYGTNCELDLSEDQIEKVSRELTKYGFKLIDTIKEDPTIKFYTEMTKKYNRWIIRW